MLAPHEVDYLLQATHSSVKRFGGDQPSLSHLAEVVSNKWSTEFVEVFGQDGTQSVNALLKKRSFVGNAKDVETVLREADDRKAVLVALQERLREAIAAATSPAEVQPPNNDGETNEPVTKEPVCEVEAPSGWSPRTQRYLDKVEPRDDLLERDEAVDQVICSLFRLRRRVPILIGAKGSGRTTLLGGVAARLAASTDGPALWRVDPALLGPEPEGPLAGIISDCPADAVLVIDDIDRIASLGSPHPNIMVLRILSAAVMLTGMKMILVCEARHFAKLDLLAEDLVRELEAVRLQPLSNVALQAIIDRVQPELESHHDVKISDELRVAACVPPRPTDVSAHPGLAVDRLDWAASRAGLAGLSEAEIVSMASPQAGANAPLPARDLVSMLTQHINGQDHAVRTVASRLALTLARLDLQPARPDGVFLFVGPTGVGKTKLARALSLCLFGSEDKLIRLDMSEYSHDWAVSRLVGPMPGYVGSTEPQSWLTTRVSEASECVVLLDEIEKAHPVVWNTFLQVFDAGRLTDSRGVTADFSNTVIVMTSNLGAAGAAGPGLGFGAASTSVDRGRQRILSAVKEVMAPELINRIDEIVVFDALSAEAIEDIAEHELQSVTARLASSGWSVSYEPDVVRYIAQSGYDPAFGARHLQRNIERRFLSLVASSDNKAIHVTVSRGELSLTGNSRRRTSRAKSGPKKARLAESSDKTNPSSTRERLK